jgi:predicted DNA-binding protein (UPF0251 family)
MAKETPIKKLIRLAGSQGKAGKLMGVSRITVIQWVHRKQSRVAPFLIEKALKELGA